MRAQKGDSVLQWWNSAFLQLKETGRYQALCETAAENHGRLKNICFVIHLKANFEKLLY